MDELLNHCEQVESLCRQIATEGGLDAIAEELKGIFPDRNFDYVLTRGKWHRLGGVVDSDYNRVTNNIAQWVNQESDGDIDEFMLKYADAGYFVTVKAGKTHYYTAECGGQAEDFIQLEIEELQEVLDRPLVDPDWIPDNIEDFLDPLDYPRLAPDAIGEARFYFRRITSIAKLVEELRRENRAGEHVRQFIADWNNSSAGDTAAFCKHWVLALREYTGADSESHVTARPLPTNTRRLIDLPDSEKIAGAELARAIHSYDRKMGYPFSWYFMMLGHQSENIALADAVFGDLMGAYDYLPAKDLKVLRDWVSQPYGV